MGIPGRGDMGSFSLPCGCTWSRTAAALLDREVDAAWLIDLDELRLVWANIAALSLWRVESLEVLRSHDFTTLLDAHTLGKLGGLRELVRQGHAAFDAWTILAENAQAIPVDVLLCAVHLSGGHVGVLCRARMGQAMRIPRGLETLEHTRLMVSMFTTQGELLFQNAASDRTHISPAPGTVDVFSARFAELGQAEQARTRLLTEQTVDEEVQVRTQSGLRWHNLRAWNTTDPATGAPCWLVEEQDISRRRRNEEALAEAQADLARRVKERTAELERQRDLLQGMFDAISAITMVVNASGRIIQANAWARTFFHGTPLVGRDVREICSFPADGELEAWFEAGDAPAEPVEITLDLPSDRRNVLWTPHLTTPSEGSPQLVLSGIDVTPLREAESHLQVADRMATIGTLAAGIAHDLNNPLAVVITNTELLLEDARTLGLEPEGMSMLQECRDGARRAATIVSQLRTFARGSASGEAGTAHVCSVVAFAARMVHNQLRHRAQMDVVCADDLFARIDESRLGQVVLNLLMLSLEAIEAGQASQHHVKVTARREPGSWLVLEVEDDGPGLKPEDLRRVFDPYSGSRTPPQGFVGLGLAVSHRIVTDAGGRIELDSAVGRGTQVQVWLPALDSPSTLPQR
ncbi:MAG: PAS domain-containing protein, partial [Myxococcales bacterium]|nr:PAS domain-containing protein [Myxococcales bacterium]